MQNPQPVTFVYTTTTTSNVHPGFACQSARALGIAQIVCGVFLIVLHIFSMIYAAGYMIIGHGIWTGIIVVIAGAFGIAAAKHRTTCVIITFMVMSIISAVFSTVPLSLSAAVVPIDLDGYGLYENPQHEGTRVTLDCAMLVFSFLEIIAAIWSSVICCKVLCCGPPSTVAPGQIQMQYVAAQPGAQQVQPVNVVIAGPSGAAGPPQYMAMPGGYVQPTSSSGQATGGDSSPRPVYGTAEVGMMTQGIGPPIEKKSVPLP